MMIPSSKTCFCLQRRRGLHFRNTPATCLNLQSKDFNLKSMFSNLKFGCGTCDNIASMVETLQFVAFPVGTQKFAVEIHRVSEVISYCEITPIPGAPPFVEGMIDLRGQLLPVLDIRKRLGIAEIRNTMQ